jgi:RNA polymerase sigma-70 factor (ECF subfamily)
MPVAGRDWPIEKDSRRGASRRKDDWFKQAILPHEGALRARVRSLQSCPADVDDLVAEVLARAYANSRWREVEHGRAFLFTTARNCIVDQIRRQKVVSFESVTDLDAFQGGLDLEAQLCARDELRRIEAVIRAMPPQAALVFQKRRIEQKSTREVAEEMQLCVSTVEKHLSRSIRLIIQALAEQEADCGEQRPRGGKAANRATGG